MRKLLVAAAMCVASVGAWAQTFSLVTDADGTVGMGFVGFSVAQPGLPPPSFADGLYQLFAPSWPSEYSVSSGIKVTGVASGGVSVSVNTFHITGGQIDAIYGYGQSGSIYPDLAVRESFIVSGTNFTYRLYESGDAFSREIVYRGNIVFSQAPAVPEPSTYALLLVGLGLAGAHRCRQSARAIKQPRPS